MMQLVGGLPCIRVAPKESLIGLYPLFSLEKDTRSANYKSLGDIICAFFEHFYRDHPQLTICGGNIYYMCI